MLVRPAPVYFRIPAPSVPEMIHQYLSIRPEQSPFHLQQPDLHRRPSLETARAPVCPQGAVARDHERERVVRKRGTDSPCAARDAEVPGDPAVRADVSPGYSVFCEKYTALEGPAPVKVDYLRPEDYVFSGEERPDIADQCADPVILNLSQRNCRGEFFAARTRVIREDDLRDQWPRGVVGPCKPDSAKRGREHGGAVQGILDIHGCFPEK